MKALSYVWARDARTRVWHVMKEMDATGRSGRTICYRRLDVTSSSEYNHPSQPFGQKCHECLRELNRDSR